MEDILSPIAMWKDFDATSLPLSTSFVNKTTEGGVVYQDLYFSGSMTVDGKVRVFANFAHPAEGTSFPTICYFAQSRQGFDLDLSKKWCKKGFAVLQVDFCGKTEEKDRYTMYPDSLSFAELSNATPNLFCMSGNPRKNFWLEWASVARRAITQACDLKQVDKQNIFAIGSDLGADLVFKICATDTRLRAGITTHPKNWMGHRSQIFYEEVSQEDIEKETSAFRATISPLAYAPHIKIPFLMMAETNEETGSFDFINAVYSRMNAPNQFLCITPRQNGVIGFAQKDSVESFLRCAIEDEFPARPEINCVGEGNELRFFVEATDAKQVEVFFCSHNTEPRARNFFSLPCSNGEFRAKAGAEEKVFLAFGGAKYDNGMYLSTRLISKTFKQAGVAGQLRPSRLIYDESMGKDCFVVAHSGKRVFEKEQLVFEKGAYELYGVGANSGSLATYKISDTQFCGFEDASLLLSVYCVQGGELSVGLRAPDEDKNLLDFVAKITLLPANEWHKITLQASDFKTDKGFVLTSWQGGQMLWLNSDSKFLLNTLLWT